MPLQPTGVKFETKNFNEFLSNMGKAAKAYINMDAWTEEMVESTRQLDGQVQKMSRSFDLLSGVTEKMGDVNRKGAEEADKHANSIFSLRKAAGEAAKGFGQATKYFAIAGNILGGVVGLLAEIGALVIPGPLDDLLAVFGAPALGTILGAITGFGVDIGVAIIDFGKSVVQQLSQVLPKVVKKVYDFVAPIVQAFIDVGKKIITGIKKVITTIADSIKSMWNAFTGLFGGRASGIGDSLFKAMFKFEILKQVIRKVIQEFKDFIKTAWDAGAILQTLTIRIDNLIARQMRNIGLTKDFTRSIEMASAYTQELLGWISELAIATPFSVDTISETVSLGLAMGWSIQGTKELTQAILDYSAAQGLSSDVMDKIIYNFAQMRQAGKVTGTELRDLARGAYMPVNTILEETAKRLGIAGDSMQEFRDMAASGAIPVEEFFKSFIEWAGREFPDAARNMNFTIQAAIDNIRDLFKTLIGWNIVKPVLDSIAVEIQKVIDSLNTPEVARSTKLIGMSLKFAVEQIILAFKEFGSIISSFFSTLNIGAPTINSIVKSIVKFGYSIRLLAIEIRQFVEDKILPIFGKMRDEVNETMSELPSDMFTWGFNMIKELGKGIIRGISMWLTKAMEMIASFLGWWLRPGSPPRIAPEIDLWGLNTISEWLRGFTEADFSMLDSMKDSLKGALGALVDLGVLDEQISAEMYVSISADLIGAIEEFNRTGEMTSVIFDQLRTVSGVFGEELATLLTMQMEFAEATERVAMAQEAYNAAVEATRASTRLVNTSIREYNALLRAGEDRSVLDQRLAEINAAEQQLALDRQAEIAAQAELDAAEAQRDIIEDMVALQEQLIQQLIDLANAQADAARAAAGGGGGGEEPGTAEEPDLLGGLGTLPNVENLGSLFESLRDTAMAELAGMWRDMKIEWMTTFRDNFGEGSAFQTAWGTMVDNLIKVWDEKIVPLFGFPQASEIATIWEGITWEDIFPFLQEDDPGFGYFPGQEWLIPDPTEDTGIFANLINLEGVIGRLRETWDLFVASIFPKEGGDKTGEPSLITDIYGAIQGLGGYLTESTEEGGWLNTLLTTSGKILGGSLIDGLLEGVRTRTVELLQNILGPFLDILAGIDGIFERGSPSQYMIRVGYDLIDGLFIGITETLTNLWSTIETAFWNFISNVLNVLGFGKSSKTGGGLTSSIFLDIGKSLIDSFVEGITNTVNSIIGTDGAIPTAIRNIINTAKEILGIKGDGGSSVFSGIGSSIMEGLKSGMENAFGSIERFLRSIISQLPQWAKDWLNIESPSGVFAEIGSNIIAGLAEGMMNTSDMAYDAMKSVIQKSLILPTVTAPVSVPSIAERSAVNFGDVTINNTMDWAMFKSKVQRAILEA